MGSHSKTYGGRTYTRDTLWAVEHHSVNRLDGDRRWFEGNGEGLARTFRTRAEARAHIENEHGYLRTRPDLKAEPHGWRMPRAVRVTVTVTAVEQ